MNHKPLTDSHKPKLIAIVGPSACGKTSLAKRLGIGNTTLISQDQYYKDWSRLPFKERANINFDHPNSFDFSLLQRHLRALKRGEMIKVPTYCYKKHCRLTRRHTLYPKRYIIVEGLYPMHQKAIRKLFDIKIYVDINAPISLSRRIKRDVRHRGECLDSVCQKYFSIVLPMQKRYVERQKKWADLVLDGCTQVEKNARLVLGLMRRRGLLNE